MTLIYGQLEKAQLENLGENPSAGVTGRIWYNTASGTPYVDESSVNSAILLNNQKIIIGTNGTAANNVRLKRSGNALMQAVPGDDASAEGSPATTLATWGSCSEKFTTVGRPAASVANAGRIILDTDLDQLLFNTIIGTWAAIEDSAPPQFAKASYTTNAGQSVAASSSTVIVFGTTVETTHGTLYDTSTGEGLIPFTSKYALSGSIQLASFTPTTGDRFYAEVRRNGTQVQLTASKIAFAAVAGFHAVDFYPYLLKQGESSDLLFAIRA